MKHLDLFSGIGGFALACEWAGIETIGFVEIDKFCQKVLKKHWPSVPIIGDIHDVKEDTFQRPVDLITGGFPCQPFSIAGKRKGDRDDRYLWPYMYEVVQKYKPTWVIGENVDGIKYMAFHKVLSDLESIGYEVLPLSIPACSVGADHLRYRIFFIAYSNNSRERAHQCRDNKDREEIVKKQKDNTQSEYNRHVETTTNTNDISGTFGVFDRNCDKTEGWYNRTKIRCEDREFFKMASIPYRELFDRGREFPEPRLVRINDGLSPELDRLKALGNAIVPQVAYQIIRAIKETE